MRALPALRPLFGVRAHSSLSPAGADAPSPLLGGGGSLAARVLPLLCVDARGVVSAVRLPVGALQAQARMSMRELLSVEQPLSSSTQPRILPRRHAIAFHLGAARGLLFCNRALLFTAPRLSSVPPDAVAAGLAAHVRAASAAAAAAAAAAAGAGAGGGGAPSPPPFEFVALEHCLFAMAARQEKRVAYAGRVLEATLSRPAALDDSRLFALLPLSTTLAHYELVSRGLMECVRALLDDARDM